MTENFLRLNFSQKSGVTPGTDDSIAMSCDQILARYNVTISGVTLTGNRCPGQNQLSSASQPPTTPTLSKYAQDYADVILEWTASTHDSGIARYNIYRGTNGGSISYLTYVDGAQLYYQDNAVSPYNIYSYYIVAVGNDSSTSNNSNTIDAATGNVWVDVTITGFEVFSPEFSVWVLYFAVSYVNYTANTLRVNIHADWPDDSLDRNFYASAGSGTASLGISEWSSSGNNQYITFSMSLYHNYNGAIEKMVYPSFPVLEPYG